MEKAVFAEVFVILSFNGNDLRVQGHRSLRASPLVGAGVRGAAQCSLTWEGLQGAGSGERRLCSFVRRDPIWGEILIFTERGCQLREATWSGFSVRAREGGWGRDT